MNNYYFVFRKTWMLLLLVISTLAFGATKTWDGGGDKMNWSDPNNWNRNGVPALGDDVIIPNGYSVTVNGNYFCASVTFNGRSATLTVGSGFTLNVTGVVILNSAGSSDTLATISGSGVLNAGKVQVGTDVTVNIFTEPHNSILISTLANFNISENLEIFSCSNSAGFFYNNSTFNHESGIIKIDGIIKTTNQNKSNTSTFSMATGGVQSGILLLSIRNPFNLSQTGNNLVNLNGTTTTVNYDGNNQDVFGTTYKNLTLSNGGAKTSTSTTVNGILSMEGTATISAIPTYGSAATLQYNTNISRTAGSEWITPFVASGGVVVKNNGAITLNGSKIFNNGVGLSINLGATLATNNFALQFGGDFTNAGTINAGSSNIIINGTANQNIGGFTTTGNVSVSKNTGVATLTGTLKSGSLTVPAGPFFNLGNGFTHTTGSLTLGLTDAGGGSWGGLTSSAINIDPTYFANATGIINVTTPKCAAGDWLGKISADWNTRTNWCSAKLPTAVTDVNIKSVPAPKFMPTILSLPVATAKNLNINPGASLTLTDSSNSLLNLSGSFTNDNEFIAGDNSVVSFVGAADVVINGTKTNIFGNLTINKNTTASKVDDIGIKTFLVKKDLKITRGNLLLSATGSNYEVKNNLTVSADGTLSHHVDWDKDGKLLLVSGNLTIDGNYSYLSGANRAHVQMNGENKTVKTGSSALSILTLGNTSGIISANGPVNVNDNFWASINNIGGTFATAGNTVTAKAALFVAGGTLLINGGTLNVSGGLYAGFSDTNGIVNLSIGTLNADDLNIGYGTRIGTFNHSGGTANVGNFTITGSQDNRYSCTNSPVINIYGTWVNNQTFIAANSTVNFVANSAKTINGNLAGNKGKFYNLTFNGLGGSWTNTSPMDVAGAITVTNGLLKTTPSADIFANSCEVKAGGTLTITPNSNFTVQNEIKNLGSGDNFVLESDANLIQINNSVNTGSVIAKRQINGLKNSAAAIDYVYWSSPVAGQKTKNSPGLADGFSPGTPNNRFYYYNESNDRFYETGDTEFRPGRGYAVRAEDGRGSPYSKSYQFKGVPNNGDISFSITRSVDNPTGVVHGYNMVGNPYPSNISFDELYAGNPGLIYRTAWFWTNASYQATQLGSGYGGNNYAVYNATGGNSAPIPKGVTYSSTVPNGIVKVGQGFLVQKKAFGPELLNFKNTYPSGNKLRVASGGTFYSKNSTEKNRFWLTLLSPSQIINSQLIGYIDGATNDYEQDYDAEAFDLSSDLFYSILPGKRLLIQGKSAAFTNDDKVQLGANFFQNGSYTIALNNAEGIFNGNQSIYLKDKQEGIITNLNEGSYTFNAAKGNNSTRFEIIYKPEAILATDTSTNEPLIVYKDGGDFVVKSQSKNITGLEVYDTTGRLINKLQPNQTKVIIPAESLVNGVYLLKINQNGVITSKKIIK